MISLKGQIDLHDISTKYTYPHGISPSLHHEYITTYRFNSSIEYLQYIYIYIYVYITYIYTYILVGGLEYEFYFPIQLGISSSQLINIVQRGSNHQPDNNYFKPPTTIPQITIELRR